MSKANIITIKPEKRIYDSIAKMSLKAIETFRKEKTRCYEQQAYARAIHDSLLENLTIFKLNLSLSEDMLRLHNNKREQIIKHHIKHLFLDLANQIYESGLFHHREYSNGYETFLDVEVAIFKGGLDDSKN